MFEHKCIFIIKIGKKKHENAMNGHKIADFSHLGFSEKPKVKTTVIGSKKVSCNGNVIGLCECDAKEYSWTVGAILNISPTFHLMLG